jgi:hypothetical protein
MSRTAGSGGFGVNQGKAAPRDMFERERELMMEAKIKKQRMEERMMAERRSKSKKRVIEEESEEDY